MSSLPHSYLFLSDNNFKWCLAFCATNANGDDDEILMIENYMYIIKIDNYSYHFVFFPRIQNCAITAQGDVDQYYY